MKRLFIFFILLYLIPFFGQAQDTTLVATSGVFNGEMPVKIFETNSKMGVMNDTGFVMLPAMYDKITFFSPQDSNSCMHWMGYLKITAGKNCGLIDGTGKPLTKFEYQDIQFIPGCCKASQEYMKLAIGKTNGKYGLLNMKGEEIVKPSLDEIILLTDKDTFPIQPEVIRVKKGELYGFLELRSTQKLPAEYQEISYLQTYKSKQKNAKPMTLLKIKQKGKYGILHLQPKMQIPLMEYEYIEAYDPNLGLALVQKGGKYGFIDIANKPIIKFQFEEAYGFRSEVSIVKKGKKWGGIDATGKTILPFEYDELKYFVPVDFYNSYTATLLISKKGDKFGLIDVKGSMILANEYDSIVYDKNSNILQLKKEGKEDVYELR